MHTQTLTHTHTYFRAHSQAVAIHEVVCARRRSERAARLHPLSHILPSATATSRVHESEVGPDATIGDSDQKVRSITSLSSDRQTSTERKGERCESLSIDAAAGAQSTRITRGSVVQLAERGIVRAERREARGRGTGSSGIGCKDGRKELAEERTYALASNTVILEQNPHLPFF